MTTDTFVSGVQALLAAGAAVASFRVLRGPSLADRMGALDLVLLLLVASALASSSLSAALGAETAREGSTLFAAPIVVVALVAFAGTVLGARFIEWRDVREDGKEEA